MQFPKIKWILTKVTNVKQNVFKENICSACDSKHFYRLSVAYTLRESIKSMINTKILLRWNGVQKTQLSCLNSGQIYRYIGDVEEIHK